AAARKLVLDTIGESHGEKSKVGLPLYAAASFHFEEGDALETAVSSYLGVFGSIQQALQADGLTYAERFLLAFLDTVVVTSGKGSDWHVEGCAIGPWHPLVVAKRLMVGR